MSLFEKKEFVMHSGDVGYFKIECDALTDKDWETIAFIVSQKYEFKFVRGVPQGGLKLMHALFKYRNPDSDVMLIVDDVLTTGKSMEDMEYALSDRFPNIKGVVIFARTKCPDWIEPVFQMWEN